MKRILALIVCGLILFTVTACGGNESDTTAQTTTAETEATVPGSIKTEWKDKLQSILYDIDVWDPDSSMPGSNAVGIMDLDFDGTPEVLIAYPGGAMGNVFVTIYDLESGEQKKSYNFGNYGDTGEIYLCVCKDAQGNYITVNEGAIRDADGWKTYIDVVGTDLSRTNYFALYEDEDKYTYMGESVSKKKYESELEAFSDKYDKIRTTELKLVKWSALGTDSKAGLVVDMTDALIGSGQAFIDFTKQ